MRSEFIFFIVSDRGNARYHKLLYRMKKLLLPIKLSHFLYTIYYIVARAWPSGRVRARAKVNCKQEILNYESTAYYSTSLSSNHMHFAYTHFARVK